RHPLVGRRTLIEYRPAAAFQWDDASPDGKPPQGGHVNLTGVPSKLVRSVTTERLLGRSQQRTRRGYDYKHPHFDMAARMSRGFAWRSSCALDPLPDEAREARVVDASLVRSERNAQRPNGLSGLTHVRTWERATGAPVAETLTSLAESSPTLLTPGAGG